MNITKLKSDLETDDIYFEYHRQRCGIETATENSVTIYDMWFGEKFSKKYQDFDEMVNDKIFDGKSLAEIIGEVSIHYT